MNELRVKERFRLLWRYFWNTNENIVLFPFRRPSNIINATYMAEIVRNAVECVDDGSVKLLVSPQTIATKTLHISVVTIEKGRELPSCRAKEVEFYYVISCATTGTNFSQQGVVESSSLKQGDFVVVDVGNMRWISNLTGDVPLVLLRVTDGGMKTNTREQIRLDPTIKKQLSKNSSSMTRVSTMDTLLDGWRQVQTIAMKYVTSTTGQMTDK
jgi:mannose-6-phosphate isomerase-like protein (cupin superfamily)